MDGEQAAGRADKRPNSGSSDDIPTFEELAADPEIAALLEFEPVPRKVKRKDGWTPELQRELIARLAVHGSPSKACEAMGKSRAGTDKLLRSPHGASFRAAWDGAVELAEKRKADEAAKAEFVGPGLRRLEPRSSAQVPARPRRPTARRSAERRRRVGGRGQPARARRGCARQHQHQAAPRPPAVSERDQPPRPGKRAAFEILTELPIDWDRAERLEPQDDEPWRRPNMREPDMLLTAENGWLGDIANATVPDKMASLRAALDQHYAERGLPAIDWKGEQDFPSP